MPGTGGLDRCRNASGEAGNRTPIVGSRKLDSSLGAALHRWMYNRFAKELGRLPVAPGTNPACSPVVLLDGADVSGCDRAFVLPPATPRGGSEVLRRGGRAFLRLRDEGSVGVDLDENRREAGDRVKVRFRFRVECGDRLTVCTVGDFNAPAPVAAAGGKVYLSAGGIRRVLGSLATNQWSTLHLETWGDATSAQLNDLPPQQVVHHPEATWVYLGQGFPHHGRFPGTRLIIDVSSVSTSVTRASR